MKEYEDIDDWKERQEEREIDNCLIMRIKKLKKQLKSLVQQVIGSCVLAFTKNKKEKRITELEKENAELKKQIKKLEKENKKIFNDWLEACDKYGKVNLEQQKDKDQLTKAKELLRFWVNDFYDNFNHSNKYEERHKALVETEQFLKEKEK